MKIKRVLGSERMYLMEDGSKVPFKGDVTVSNDMPETVTIDEAVEVLEQKPKKKRRKRKKKKSL